VVHDEVDEFDLLALRVLPERKPGRVTAVSAPISSSKSV
jgi:hypothetical protein